LSCRPPSNQISTPEAEEALRCCRPGLEAEILDVASRGLRVICTLGNTAAEALGIREAISKARGSIYLYNPVQRGSSIPIVPTYHPAAILYSKEKTIARGTGSAYSGGGPSAHILRPVMGADLGKVQELGTSTDGYHPPAEIFLILGDYGSGSQDNNQHGLPNECGGDPYLDTHSGNTERDNPPNGIRIQDNEGTAERSSEFTERSVSLLHSWAERRQTVGVDIETIGWNPGGSGRIFCIGLAGSETEAVVVPYSFLDPSNSSYSRDLAESVRSVLRENPTVFQNAKFDIGWLEHFGFRIGNLTHDVMLMHHVISPELPHDLGFIVSIYGKTPYWKGEMLNRDMQLDLMPPETVFTYNARDSVVLLQVLPGLLKDLEDSGAKDSYYNISMKMIRPIMEMEKRGMKVSPYRVEQWKKELETQKEALGAECHEILGSDAVSLSSDDDLRFCVFGLSNRRLDTAEEEIAKRVGRTNTKVYRELQRLRGVRTVRPLFPQARRKGTATRGASVADDTLLSLVRESSNRIALIDRFRRPTPEHLAEREDLKRGTEFVSKLREYNGIDKLLSTYTKFPIADDGRVHPQFLIHGTTTGRLSCKKPNLQNQPESARVVFTADEGNVLLSADYSNLELRVLAYISNDRLMLSMFEKGLNIHDENTKALFGIGPDHPKWKAFRKAAKIYIFGRNYGGSVEGIFERVLAEVPDSGLTLGRFRQVDETYRRLHPDYMQWYERTRSEVLEKRRISNAFGRVRTFFGNQNDILKEGLNTPIQGTAADIINTATIRIYEEGIPIICQVHDQLIFEVNDGAQLEVASIVRPLMEREFKINGHNAVFPIVITCGKCWAKLDPLSP
jgi:DNA polymerase I-like protein with 3'-5' exonuclease and polymerase domains